MSFESYLDTHQPNPKRAALLTFAGVIAVSGTLLMLVAGWVAGKLQIARVEAPTMDYVLLALTVDEPLPPPPPPPPPAGSSEPEPEEVEDVIPEDEDIEQPPDEVPKDIPKQKASSSSSSQHTGGIPGGVKGGVMGGVLGAPPTMIPGSKPIAVRPPQQQEQTLEKPLAAVMAQSVYAPDPSAKQLQLTRAARFEKRDGKNVTAFCIDTNGRTVNVRTKTPFPGDPEVDKIIRNTIKSWRFKPFVLGSKKVKTCTERTFMLRFK